MQHCQQRLPWQKIGTRPFPHMDWSVSLRQEFWSVSVSLRWLFWSLWKGSAGQYHVTIIWIPLKRFGWPTMAWNLCMLSSSRSGKPSASWTRVRRRSILRQGEGRWGWWWWEWSWWLRNVFQLREHWLQQSWGRGSGKVSSHRIMPTAIFTDGHSRSEGGSGTADPVESLESGYEGQFEGPFPRWCNSSSFHRWYKCFFLRMEYEHWHLFAKLNTGLPMDTKVVIS